MRNFFRANQSPWLLFLFCSLAVISVACMAPLSTSTPTQAQTLPPTGTPSPTPMPTIIPTTMLSPTVEEPVAEVVASPSPAASPSPEPVRFAVIGDYGSGDQNEADVANLVKSWDPDLIITVGDNNYPLGAAATIDDNVGQFFHEFIYPYMGEYGGGAEVNRFFPTQGNHDWDSKDAQPYLDYFTLPGNERYYDFTWGPVHFFALDSDSREPDGVWSGSTQALWLQGRLAESNATWKVVYMHHPPYSSGYHGPVEWMRWPFEEWGASVVISGHDHHYERLVMDGFPYLINGLGGGAIYGFQTPLPGTEVRYNDDYGAMLVEASVGSIIFQFINRDGEIIDTYTLQSDIKPEVYLFMPLVRLDAPQLIAYGW